ncbi:MAG: DMT family transporter [Ferruginibacter sp.]
MHQKTKAHLALLFTNIFFAINYTAVKQLINSDLIKPFGLNLLRVGLSVILLWILFLFKPIKVRLQKKEFGRFFLCALTGIAINQLLFLKGLSITYSIHASLLMLTTPILITFFASWALKEKLNVYKISGLILGLTGAAVLIAAKENAGTGSRVLLGDILILLNAISYTIYFILVKPLMKHYDPLVVIRVIFTIGFFMILPFCWKEFTEIPWPSYTFQSYGLLALIILGGTFLAYIFNVYGLKILGASMAGTYIYSQPVFAASIAIVFLGEELSLYKIIAAVFIFAGVYLANKTVSNG